MRTTNIFFIFILASLFQRHTFAISKNSCLSLLQSFFFSQQEVESVPINTTEDIFKLFRDGLLPNFQDSQQRNAFELYRNHNYKNPSVLDYADFLPFEILKERFKEHPNLSKTPFRNFILNIEEEHFPVSRPLNLFIGGLTKSVGKISSNLYRVKANQGHWKKVFQYQEKDFDNFLGDILPDDFLEDLKSQDGFHLVKIEKFFHILNQQRERMIEEEKNVSFISQAIVDLIASSGFQNIMNKEHLKAKDGMKVISTLEKIFAERDFLCEKLGFSSFQQLLKHYDVSWPTGIPLDKHLFNEIEKFRNALYNESTFVLSDELTKKIRHLSLIESPFRSCMGGANDCASETYFDKALDPNFHYFTLTDKDGVSDGQITIVLGEGTHRNKKTKIAFIDKIQNVNISLINAFLEGIRRSVKEKGYILALPSDVGAHNGISNSELIRTYINEEISHIEKRKRILDFAPHSHEYKFPNVYSRAYDDQLELIPLTAPFFIVSEQSLMAEKIVYPWKAKSLDMSTLSKEIRELKFKDLEDKILYIKNQSLLKGSQLEFDPEFHSTLTNWLQNSQTEFALKKHILYYRWIQENDHLEDLLTFLRPQEKVIIIQNILDTPKLKRVLLRDRKTHPYIMTYLRSYPKVLIPFLDETLFRKQDYSIAQTMLSSKEISDERLVSFFKNMKIISSLKIDSYDKILKSFEKTTPYEDIQNYLLDRFLSEQGKWKNPFDWFFPKEKEYTFFEKVILDTSSHPEWKKHFPLLRILSELKKIYENDPTLSKDMLINEIFSSKNISQKDKKNLLDRMKINGDTGSLNDITLEKNK